MQHYSEHHDYHVAFTVSIWNSYKSKQVLNTKPLANIANRFYYVIVNRFSKKKKKTGISIKCTSLDSKF